LVPESTIKKSALLKRLKKMIVNIQELISWRFFIKGQVATLSQSWKWPTSDANQYICCNAPTPIP
jgi:hypothetical protein